MSARPPKSTTPPRRGFRRDIEGLRAVAVLLVVLSHAGVEQVTGGYIGVDVFFVISGFLITSLLIREVATTGRISLRDFYARRAVRLLPMSTLVLIVTLAGAWLWLSPVRTGGYAIDAFASAAYAVNMRFAVAGTDYFANSAPSPFQHFWSLAVEEQFYVGWPLLLIATIWFLRRRRNTGNPLRVVGAVLATVVVTSLVWSAFELDRSAPWAYFGLPSRAWELGVGALVALAAGRLALMPRRVAALLGGLGLLAVLGTALAYDDTTSFPGVTALLPVAGAAAVIAAGTTGDVNGVGRLLAVSPLQIIGKLSYGWYLWHWPALVIVPVALHTDPGVYGRLGLCAGALALAFVTYHLVENPVRHRRSLLARPRRTIAWGMSLSATAAVIAVGTAALPVDLRIGGPAPDTRAAVTAAADPQRELAALIAHADQATVLPANLKPTLTAAAADAPGPQVDGCHLGFTQTSSMASCSYGRANSPTTVVLFGDSHALQWFPALDRLAVEQDWRLISLTKSSCSPVDIPLVNLRLKRTYRECRTWRDDAMTRIRELAPQLVVMATSTSYRGVLDATSVDPDTAWRAGSTRTLNRLRTSADAVVVLGDTPFLYHDPIDCLAMGEAINRCAEPADEVLRDTDWRKILEAEVVRAGALFVDPVPWVCTTVCPGVVGNLLVYRDTNHFSTGYAEMLAPLLRERLPSTNAVP